MGGDAAPAIDGLVVHPAKMSVELHPPVAVDKGTAVLALAAGLRAVCFLGDDVGDLPGLRRPRRPPRRRASPRRRSPCAAPRRRAEVLAAADVVVDGPAGAVEVLRALVP